MKHWTVYLICIVALTTAEEQNSPIIYSKLTEAHVSYENFKILYYFDIEYMYKLSNQIDHIMEHGEKLCNRMMSTYCELALEQLRKNRLTIKFGLKSIDNYNSRRVKRFCDWCGQALHWATGVLDNSVAKVYDEKINELQNVTITQHDLLRNQTYIAEATMKINTKILEKLEQGIYDVNLEMTNLVGALTSVGANLRFNEIIQLGSLMISEHQEIIHQVKQTLTEAKFGKIPDLINENQLNDDIKKIHNGLSSNQALPIDFKNEAAMKIFKYASTAAIKYGHRIMIEITIPITAREKYSLYKATAVPMKLNDFTLIAKLQTKYFLINTDDTKFIALGDEDLKRGLKLNANEMIYRPSAIVRLDKENICEWKVMNGPSAGKITEICELKQIPNGNYVFEINRNDIYFISIRQEMKYILECDNHETIRKTIIDDEIMKIEQNCQVKTESFTIQPHNTFTLNTSQIMKPDLWSGVLPEDKMEAWLNRNLTKIEMAKPVLITEFNQLHNLIASAEQLAEKSNFDLKLKNVHEAATTSSMMWIAAAVIALLAAGSITACYILYKIGPLRLLLGPEEIVLEQAANVVFQNLKGTPHPSRRASKSTLEMN